MRDLVLAMIGGWGIQLGLNFGVKSSAAAPVAVTGNLLLETGDSILLEDGSKLVLD